MRVMLSFLVSIILILLYCSNGFSISGPCVNCHTMHNSQNNQPMVEGGPYPALTRGNCAICHKTDTGNAAIENNIPKVYHTTDPGYVFGSDRGATLAGGDFYYVTLNDTYGHNVLGVDSDGYDETLSTPPGYNSAYRGGQDWSTQHALTCAGKWGCHGNYTVENPFEAISGAHHNNIVRTPDNHPDPTSVAVSYRFLMGIRGLEDDDWEANVDASDHNQYYAVDQKPTPGSNTGSINYLCAECHGDFHNGTYDGNYASPWLRHPTDYDMNNVKTKEYGNYPGPFNDTAGATNYYFWDVPVGAAFEDSVRSQVLQTDDDAIVLCLSCHKAHGSPYPDILRWDYGACNTGQPSQSTQCGCFACHTTK